METPVYSDEGYATPANRNIKKAAALFRSPSGKERSMKKNTLLILLCILSVLLAVGGLCLILLSR